MMSTLHTLTDASRAPARRKRLGRGNSSQRGKTCCRGHKGDKSRSGYKRRYGKEGGQLPLWEKLPTRGFNNVRFAIPVYAITLDRIEKDFEDGEKVSRETLIAKGYPLRRVPKLKIIGTGELKKKVAIEAHIITKGAMRKLEEEKIEFTVIHKAK